MVDQSQVSIQSHIRRTNCKLNVLKVLTVFLVKSSYTYSISILYQTNLLHKHEGGRKVRVGHQAVSHLTGRDSQGVDVASLAVAQQVLEYTCTVVQRFCTQ